MRKIRSFITIGTYMLLSCCTSTESQETTVYITTTGNKYHNSDCRYLGKSCIPSPLQEAISRGYEPCSNCKPYFNVP